MDLSDDIALRILAYFGERLGRPISSKEELAALPSGELLRLADHLPDAFLPALVSILKGQGPGVFEKLLGEHEEENREMSDRFFQRYGALVLESEGEDAYNPLFVYLPPEACQDLAFLSTRQAFFLRQEIATINQWLAECFGLGPFEPGEQGRAWNALWAHLTKS